MEVYEKTGTDMKKGCDYFASLKLTSLIFLQQL